MKKISVKDLVEFRRKSDRGKKTFIENVKSNRIEKSTDGGGDYWIPSLSAIRNSYRSLELNLIDEKIDELKEKLNNNKHTITKNMYQRNIEILRRYKDMDFKKLRPNSKLSFLKKTSGNSLLTVKGLQIEVKPCHIYTFEKDDEEKVGAIWFTAKINGYLIEEIGLFCDMLYRFLRNNYSKKYHLIPKYCIVVELLSGKVIDYSEIESGKISQLLASTLDEINRLL